MQNFRKLAEFKIPKNREELYNNVNIAKSKNLKSVIIRKKIEIQKNGKKNRGKVILKAHAKFHWNRSMGR